MDTFDGIEAKRYFLQILRQIRCDKFENCKVWAQDDFPVNIGSTPKPLTLNTSCTGLFFFEQDPNEDRQYGENSGGLLRSVKLKIDFYHLAYIRLSKYNKKNLKFLHIKAVINEKIIHFHVATEFGKEIIAAVDLHAPEVERDAILNKYTRKHGVPGILFDTVSNKRVLKWT